MPQKIPTIPIVSVIVPTYNRAHFLTEAIESVLTQTYQDWELIIVDDGSADDTKALSDQCARRDHRIRVIHQANSGVAKARNAGLRAATGRYIAFLDDDDRWVPEKLERQVAYLDAHPEIGLAFTLAQLVDQELRHIKVLPQVWRCSFEALLERCFIPLPTVMVRRECLNCVGDFDEALGTSADYDLWLRIARRFEIACLEEPLALYQRHGANMSLDGQRRIREHLVIYRKLLAGDLEHRLVRVVRRRIAQEHYEWARRYRSRGEYRSSARHFAQAVVTYPSVGLHMQRGRRSPADSAWLLAKPYLAISYCFLKGLWGRGPRQRKPTTGPKRILVIEYARSGGGSMISISGLLANLDRSRFEPVILLDGCLPPKFFRSLNCKVIRLTKPFERIFRHLSLQGPAAYLMYAANLLFSVLPHAVRIVRVIKKEGVDLVHLNNHLDQFSGILAAKWCGVPCVCHLRYVQPLRWSKRLASKYVNTLIVLSPFAKDVFAKQGLPEDKFEVIHNPVLPRSDANPEQQADLRRALNVPSEGRIVTIFSRLVPGKGHEMFLRAAACVRAAFPKTWFLILGADATGGRLIQHLRELAGQLQLTDRVVWTGWREDAGDIVSISDVIVDVSEMQEGSRRTILEAMALGKPIVATSMGDADAILENRLTGLLVPRGDAESTARAITDVLGDPAWANRMGQAAREKALLICNPRKSTDLLERIYERLTSGGASSKRHGDPLVGLACQRVNPRPLRAA